MSDAMLVPILAVAGISLVYPLFGGCLCGIILIVIATLSFGKCDRTFNMMTSAAIQAQREINRSQEVENSALLQKNFDRPKGVDHQEFSL